MENQPPQSEFKKDEMAKAAKDKKSSKWSFLTSKPTAAQIQSYRDPFLTDEYLAALAKAEAYEHKLHSAPLTEDERETMLAKIAETKQTLADMLAKLDSLIAEEVSTKVNLDLVRHILRQGIIELDQDYQLLKARSLV